MLIVRIITMILITFSHYHASSNDAKEDVALIVIDDFFAQLENTLNSRDIKKIKDYYEFYANTDAVFIKKSFLFDKNAIKIAESDLSMNKKDFVNYTLQSVMDPSFYSATIKVNKKSRENSILLQATVEIEEKARKNHVEMNIISICNYYLENKNKDIYISSMSCQENIQKIDGSQF